MERYIVASYLSILFAPLIFFSFYFYSVPVTFQADITLWIDHSIDEAIIYWVITILQKRLPVIPRKQIVSWKGVSSSPQIIPFVLLSPIVKAKIYNWPDVLQETRSWNVVLWSPHKKATGILRMLTVYVIKVTRFNKMNLRILR